MWYKKITLIILMCDFVLDYKTAGVDIDSGNVFVEDLKKHIPTIGGFNGMMKIPSGYTSPVLVSSTDGVGTKINIATLANDYTTIGIDLVAMCVNDVITNGATPMYFLDYISTKKIDKSTNDIISSIIRGCKVAGLTLLGGETAEHINQQHPDIAGFCTGIVEESRIIDSIRVKPNDVVIGLASSGLHSNGYSIVNYLLTKNIISYKDHPELLTPTTIYVDVVKRLIDSSGDNLHGMAHITGGGIVENLPRCLPNGLVANIDFESWPVPDIFIKIQSYGNISDSEMRRVFNMGIGFCIVVSPSCAAKAMVTIKDIGINCWRIGVIGPE